MTAPFAPFARIDRARGVIVLARGSWTGDMEPASLPSWIRFYDRLAAKRSGKRGEPYREDAAELRRVQKALEARPI